ARIHAGRGDYAGALPFLAEFLKANVGQQELWFLLADSARVVGKTQLQAEWLERGIALGGNNVARRQELVTYYIKSGDRDKALQHVRQVLSTGPRDANVRATFASFLETLNEPDECLRAWRETLSLDQRFEPAHYNVARLLLARKDARSALAVTESALSNGAGSARVYLMRAAAYEALGNS